MAASKSILSSLFGLEGQVAVVAGGAGRIGSVFGCRIGRRRARRFAFSISRRMKPQELRSNWPRAAGRSSLSKPIPRLGTELEAALAAIVARLGMPTILVNTTQFRGKGFYSSDVSEYPLDAWENVIDVNLTGVFLTCQVFGRAMAASGGGRIVNLASTYGVVSADPRIYGDSGVNSPVSYAASKAAGHQSVSLSRRPLAREEHPCQLPGPRRRSTIGKATTLSRRIVNERL